MPEGFLRVAIGRRLVYSHHDWLIRYEPERVLRVRAGEIVRDREVGTRAIVEWWLRRNPGLRNGWTRPIIRPLADH